MWHTLVCSCRYKSHDTNIWLQLSLDTTRVSMSSVLSGAQPCTQTWLSIITASGRRNVWKPYLRAAYSVAVARYSSDGRAVNMLLSRFLGKCCVSACLNWALACAMCLPDHEMLHAHMLYRSYKHVGTWHRDRGWKSLLPLPTPVIKWLKEWHWGPFPLCQPFFSLLITDMIMLSLPPQKQLDTQTLLAVLCVDWIRMAVAGGIKCIKYLMFVFNLFFWVSELYFLLWFIPHCEGEGEREREREQEKGSSKKQESYLD